MPLDDLFQYLINFNFWILAKIFILTALGLYFLFAFVIIKEVNLMTRTVKSILTLPLKIISWVHLALVLLIFTLAVIIL